MLPIPLNMMLRPVTSTALPRLAARFQVQRTDNPMLIGVDGLETEIEFHAQTATPHSSFQPSSSPLYRTIDLERMLPPMHHNKKIKSILAEFNTENRKTSDADAILHFEW
jgi:hypothetical protein